MKNILIVVVLVALAWFILIKATDRVCTKNFSQEFKQSQQYKDMKCPQ